MTFRIGVIADTHGVVHPRVGDVFAGVDHILHAGDIGGEHVLDALRAIAPITTVNGNNDDATGEEIVRVTLGGLRVLLTHILPRPHRLDRRVVDSLRDEPADVVVFGHSHLPHNEVVGGVRYFNPSSAGPRRFDYPTSVGFFEIEVPGVPRVPRGSSGSSDEVPRVPRGSSGSSEERRFLFSEEPEEPRNAEEPKWRFLHAALDERSVEALTRRMNQMSR